MVLTNVYETYGSSFRLSLSSELIIGVEAVPRPNDTVRIRTELSLK
jgi:hypothetical protein